MEEINRLHDIADDIASTSWGYELAAALHRIAADIGEKVDEMRHVGEYEDDVLTFVDAYGGLEEVKAHMIPEGMEWLLDVWPKWSNGEYCKFGDWWKSEKYGESEPQQLRKLSIYTPEQLREWGQDDGDNFGYDWDFMRPGDPKYRPEKVEPPAPKVLDADGVEIEVGDDLYSVEGGLKLHVGVIDTRNGKIATAEMYALDKWADPSLFTHRAPVFAADGKPLREEETVWGNKGGSYHLTSVHDGKVFARHVGGSFGAEVESAGGEGLYRLRADQLTHERPDSWERLEEDASDVIYDIGLHLGDYSPSGFKEKGDSVQDRVRDIVRRAKALAERDR